MSRQIVKLERTWGTDDHECRAFLLALYRQLYGPDATKGAAAEGPFVDRECQEVVVDADSQQEAWVILLLAAVRADPAWRRLYRLAG